MKPAPFDYVAATSVDDVLDHLAEHGPDTRVLAGGQSLVRLMNSRLATPAYLIDINGVTDLDRITVQDAEVVIGAITRQRTAETDPMVRRHIPVFAAAGHEVAHVSVRERGTVVGSVAFADPSAELPVALLALDGSVVARSRTGERVIAAADFFTGAWQNALADDELAVEVRIPAQPRERSGSAFLEVSRRHGELPVCAVAAIVTLDEAGALAAVRIALGSVGDRPVRARSAERQAVGRPPGADTYAALADATVLGLEPVSNLHGSADFRRHLAGVVTRRALTAAVADARSDLGAGAAEAAAPHTENSADRAQEAPSA